MIINKKIVASCPHFRNLQEADICMIIQNLQLQLYLSEEKIIFQGEKGTHVRFIINGSAQVYLTRQVPLNQIRAVPGF